MNLDAVLHKLLPKDDKFLKYFEEDVANLVEAAQVFTQLMSNDRSPAERMTLIKDIERLEHQGDELTHRIFSELSSTFITPFDREDIHELASKLDDILDFIHGAAGRIVLYRVETITPEMSRLAAMIYDQIQHLSNAIPHMRNLKNVDEIRSALVKINSVENEADDLFERAIAHLFDTCKDPILLIKQKELLVSLETATDKCEDAANAIETIIVKNA